MESFDLIEKTLVKIYANVYTCIYFKRTVKQRRIKLN